MFTVLRFLFVLPLAFVTSCGTSAFALLWPYFQEGADGRMTDPVYLFQWGIAYFAQAAQIGSAMLIPWAIFMVVTEIAGLSSLLLHLAAGLVGAVAVILLAYGVPAPSASIQVAIVIAGLVFILTYWLIAGRSAGKWRKRQQAHGSPPPLPPSDMPPRSDG